ncbi:unnamed protein product [Pleuronectes platessa]|uniref:Uncharacterized protein n=1 Tax=Pleuronectes platessa TaxID=8262 RepID=A0A9N7VW68_PLEPL|nr:unnamed protein product [Pleuronectes platessa]
MRSTSLISDCSNPQAANRCPPVDATCPRSPEMHRTAKTKSWAASIRTQRPPVPPRTTVLPESAGMQTVTQTQTPPWLEAQAAGEEARVPELECSFAYADVNYHWSLPERRCLILHAELLSARQGRGTGAGGGGGGAKSTHHLPHSHQRGQIRSVTVSDALGNECEVHPSGVL